MNKEQIEQKAIEEMAEVIAKTENIAKDMVGALPSPTMYAKDLYWNGYRKQSEPISCDHEKGGEWVQLPCKVGDILYVISPMKDKRFLPFINEYEVTSISIKRKSIVVWHEMDGFMKKFKQSEFGKTVFLSKLEAERAVTDNNVGCK